MRKEGILALPDQEKSGDKKLPRIPYMGIFIRILIFLVLVAGTAVLLRPVQLTLQARMDKIRDDFIRETEEF